MKRKVKRAKVLRAWAVMDTTGHICSDLGEDWLFIGLARGFVQMQAEGLRGCCVRVEIRVVPR
jgi:hypothetical protein